MVNDPIGDFIIRLTNASAVGKQTVDLPYSRLKHAIADALVASGYLKSAVQKGKTLKKTLTVGLIYTDGKARIRGVKRISKPGRRLYTGTNNIRSVKFGRGKLVLSTPKGILTGEQAKKENVGGEQLFSIW